MTVRDGVTSDGSGASVKVLPALAGAAVATGGVALVIAVPVSGWIVVGFALMGAGYAIVMPLVFARAAADPHVPPGCRLSGPDGSPRDARATISRPRASPSIGVRTRRDRPPDGVAMELYLDTADRDAAEALLATGLFAGLTTNPTILQRASLGVADIPDIYAWSTGAGAAAVFFQAWGRDTATLLERGRTLRALGDEVVVKLVASKAGAAACAQLSAEGIPTLLTAIHDPAQAVVAAAADATYIAPYLRRMTAAGRDGAADVITMHRVLSATGSDTRVLVASIPDVSSIVRLAAQGIEHFTMAPSIAEDFFADELTAEAIDTFENAVADPVGRAVSP